MNILICDDSKIARKALSSNIELSQDLTLFYAENGKEGLDVLRAHSIDILFLDLTMPVMDGFDVLSQLPINTYPTQTVVISGDVQEKAKQRCYQLGANEFINKPFKPEEIADVLLRYGIPVSSKLLAFRPKFSLSSANLIENIKEISNVALGASAALISEQFDRFIDMPLPNVASLHHSELQMTLQDIVNNSEYRAISQRFVGYGINGEALVCLHGSDLADLLSVDQGNEQITTNEAILDIANLLVSSFLSSFNKQLNIEISLRQPIVLETEQLKVALKESHSFLNDYESDIFTIEFVYSAESLDLKCDVIFLMDNDSLTAIKSILESVL
ncbi:two-component system response regulator [Aliivibrio sp. 1S165]|uniref:response regulator n=1 Tax=unclassified Aliivibrio TaxID=2645654 RepID=UPI00080DE96F|nr:MULTISPECIES: response regulator [unclassified Aliivibrio]OCH16149.1 two-component system response regulator [Aliivibrio sp. 1S165]OCH26809.1 two-component system response regulator [Aliivibrio sp. 1S175]